MIDPDQLSATTDRLAQRADELSTWVDCALEEDLTPENIQNKVKAVFDAMTEAIPLHMLCDLMGKHVSGIKPEKHQESDDIAAMFLLLSNVEAKAKALVVEAQKK